jgi:sigma-E factor negative regulatory protein RseB
MVGKLMMMKASIFLVITILFAPVSYANEDLADWLKRMEKSVRELNYRALMVVQNGQGRLSSVELTHRGPVNKVAYEKQRANNASYLKCYCGCGEEQNNFEQIRLRALDGLSREMLIDGDEISVFVPEKPVVETLRNPLADTFLTLGNSLEHYKPRFAGDSMVAGREAKVFDIISKDANRYSYRLWLDKETGMYLRANWYNQNKFLLEAMVVQLEFLDTLPFLGGEEKDCAEPQKDPDGTTTVEASKEDNTGVKVGWLPDGFHFSHKYQYPPEDSGKTEHMVFSDGTLRVSVYVEDSVRKALQSKISLGRTNGLTIDVRDKQVTVLAEMPLPTVEKIATSISVNEEASNTNGTN